MTLLEAMIEDVSTRKLKKISERLQGELAGWVERRSQVEDEIEKLTENVDLINREIESRNDTKKGTQRKPGPKRTTVATTMEDDDETKLVGVDESMTKPEEEEPGFEEPRLRVTDDDETAAEEEPPAEQEPSDERAALWDLWEDYKSQLSDHQMGALRAMTRVHRIKSNIKIEKLRAVVEAAQKILNKQATVRR
jgi:hypothetical protein